MAYPPIHHCLICEEVRAERRGLVTLLGFYGVTPDVQILVRDFNVPLRASFVLVGATGAQGNFKTSVRLSDESGNLLIATPEIDVTLPDPSKHANLAVGFAALQFPAPGKYTFELIVDSQSHYRTSFQVLQGKPGDFD